MLSFIEDLAEFIVVLDEFGGGNTGEAFEFFDKMRLIVEIIIDIAFEEIDCWILCRCFIKLHKARYAGKILWTQPHFFSKLVA